MLGSIPHQLLPAHKPLVLLCLLWSTGLPRVTETCAYLWCGYLSSVPDPRCSTLVVPHSYCSSSSRILDTSAHWPMLCCASLLVCWSPAPWLLPNVLHQNVSSLLTQAIFLVAILHPLHRPNEKACLWSLCSHWSEAPMAPRATPYANFCPSLLGHGTFWSSFPAGSFHELTLLACLSVGAPQMMVDAGCQNLHNIWWTLLLWTVYHYLSRLF